LSQLLEFRKRLKKKAENLFSQPFFIFRYPDERKQPFPALYFPKTSAKALLFDSWIFLEAEKELKSDRNLKSAQGVDWIFN
jgi:hypothetical protein